jgi:general stress protein 26
MNRTLSILVIIFLLWQIPVFAAEEKSDTDRERLLTAARAMIGTSANCMLITTDSIGFPVARMMDPFAPDSNFVIWFGTNRYSRKVEQIVQNPRVSVFYPGPNGSGYVLIKGRATLIDDEAEKQAHWKKAWDQFYTKDRSNYTLIRFEPEQLEILDTASGILGDDRAWTPPIVDFTNDNH